VSNRSSSSSSSGSGSGTIVMMSMVLMNVGSDGCRGVTGNTVTLNEGGKQSLFP